MPWSCHIDLLTGPRAGQRLSFDLRAVPRITLGTDALAQVSFDRADYPLVERRHAVLSAHAENDSLMLVDSSRTGTLVHGKPIRSIPIDGPTEIQLGPEGPLVRVIPERLSQRPEVVATPSPVIASAPEAGPETPSQHAHWKPLMLAGLGCAGLVALFWWSPRSAAPDEAVLQLRLKRAQEDMQRDVAERMARMDEELRKTKQQVNGSIMDVDASVAAAKAGQSKGDADMFLQSARQFERAVGLVTLPNSSGTGFAVGPRTFATNSHISKPAREALAKGESCFVIVNKGQGKRLRIVRAEVHPRYDENFKQPGGAYDVGLLFTDEDTPVFMKIASDDELKRVDAGYPVAYIGFPQEGLSGGNVDFSDPIATMKTGIVTSVSRWDLSSGSFEDQLLIRENLGAAGGASGSPLFNRQGEVIAIHNAGNYLGKLGGKRLASAAQIEFSQRIDCLKDIWPDYPKR